MYAKETFLCHLGRVVEVCRNQKTAISTLFFILSREEVGNAVDVGIRADLVCVTEKLRLAGHTTESQDGLEAIVLREQHDIC